MNNLVLQRQNLKRKKFIFNSIEWFHYFIPGIGIALFQGFYGNKVLSLLGLGLFIYYLFWLLFNSFGLNSLERNIIKIDDSLLEAEKIHNSLDSLRDSLLFDNDSTYWKVIEKLEI